MNRNDSPHWPPPPGARQLAEQRALNAVIDGWTGMTGERYRIDRAGVPPHLVAGPGRPAALPLGFTMHVAFGAQTLADAREQAVRYVEGLAILRPEVTLGVARLSHADAWHLAEPLFCGAVGPDGETCVDVLEHPGFHRAAGINALSWGGGDPG